MSFDRTPALRFPTLNVLSSSTAPVSFTAATSLSDPLTVIVIVAVSVAEPSERV